MSSTGTARDFAEEVAGRFGVLPNFFGSALATSALVEELWTFARSAYHDSPLPSLFKERLFVHLSRFCEVRYCIVRHVGLSWEIERSRTFLELRPPLVIEGLWALPFPALSRIFTSLPITFRPLDAPIGEADFFIEWLT